MFVRTLFLGSDRKANFVIGNGFGRAVAMMEGVIALLSTVLHGIYIILPAASLGAFAFRGRPWLKRTIAGAWISGSILAAAVLAAYVMAIGGSASYLQIGMAIYFGVALMLLLKLVDALFRRAIGRVFKIDRPDTKRSTLALAMVLRVVVFGAFALPWVMSAVMVYRPRVQPDETPGSILRVEYEAVTFPARDGTRIAGWYVPAKTASPVTELLCHGLGASKSGMWSILRGLHEADVNVLTIDLRAHGYSGGNLTTFGAKEPDDVLGAIDWLRLHHVEDSDRIVGVGASLGAAALIDAAARDVRIDAVVSIGTFDSFSTLASEISEQHMVPPISWLTQAMALPMASLHAGVDLSSISPGDHIADIWPRPVMIVHGANDEIIPFAHGKRLYDKAFSPRESVFTGGTHNGVLDDPAIVARIVEFVLHAQPVPVI